MKLPPMLQDVVDRIEQRLTALGISARAASLRAGLSGDAIRNMKRAATDDSRQGVSTNTIMALAPVLEVSVSWLLGDDADHPPIIVSEQAKDALPYRGVVQAGAFFRVDLLADQRNRGVRIPRDTRYAKARQYVWRIEGDSMNRAGLYPGMFALGVDLGDYESIYRPLDDGDVVVVERLRAGGQEMETTIKKFYRDNGGITLQPDSSNPKHTALFIPHDSDAVGEEIRISAYVSHGFTMFGDPFIDLDEIG